MSVVGGFMHVYAGSRGGSRGDVRLFAVFIITESGASIASHTQDRGSWRCWACSCLHDCPRAFLLASSLGPFFLTRDLEDECLFCKQSIVVMGLRKDYGLRANTSRP